MREARKRLGWSADELAERMAMDSQTVYRWEWEVRRPTVRKAQALALVLGVRLISLAQPRE